ncbi:MAG: hypothetical protein H0W02_00605 [Ktedonobacteraceae bacterium]|nr:hypothetical protein [Ktedonobacteraceae bacterium]
MNCEELSQLVPDLVDGTLSAELQAEAEAMLPQCPECLREVELARQIRAVLVALQSEHADLRIPAGFEARLLARVRAQHTGVELVDLSSRAFGLWLVELLNVIGALIGPGAASRTPGLQPGI